MIYKIKELSAQIKEILEGSFGYVTVEGEISNCRPASSGHLYFTLKDDKASISAVMFKSKFSKLTFKPTDGMLVQASGTISVYEVRGTYQIVVESMDIAGEGDILKMLEERKRKLSEEGLFDADLKKPLPFFPTSVAVITSQTGAAVRDIINVITRRNPKVNINILPAVVQGADSAKSLIRQLKVANLHKLGDVIILTRGGGSLEDLLPFSDEAVVREVFASKIPVISAVGHEIDWAISDFAADERAPTPSAAAELAVPILTDVQMQIADSQDDIISAIQNRVERIKLMLSGFTAEALELQFRNIEQPFLNRLDDAKEDLLSGMQEAIKNIRRRIEMAKQAIELSSPQNILDRGFSIVRKKNTDETIRDASVLNIGDELEIIPAKGNISAVVQTVKK